ncbi:MTOR-associated protein MEAK7-like [Sycon ciliatum]|uniref:MTOR-associated protein MEAK7-like n=1 Tax=Sycon ciliatum TaxID=27933 RepID=UPI0020AED1E8|eukprot:scpid53514/ scgid25075/ TLD domain-containing protein KIAA1609 homolog
MGAEHSKNPEAVEAIALLSEHERHDLSTAFRQLVSPDGKSEPDAHANFDVISFQAFSRKVLAEDMSKRFHQAMSEKSALVDRDLVDRDAFTISVANITKGNLEKKCHYYVRLAADYRKGVSPTPSAPHLHHLVCGLITAALNSRALNPRVNVWGGATSEANAKLARTMLDEMIFAKHPSGERKSAVSFYEDPIPDDVVFSEADLEKWLLENALMPRLFDHVFRSMFFAASDLAETVPDGGLELPLLPVLDGSGGEESLLDPTAVLYLNNCLPMDCRQNWRQVFDTKQHGQSFATMLQKLEKVGGPSLLVVRDSDGYVFGGFASVPWTISSQYQGDNSCFLFSLSRGMGIFNAGEYNDHFMYLNHEMETLPNGLAMGGQPGYYGLFLAADFGSGHSHAEPTCTTYNSPQLSKEKEFVVSRVEVWAVGQAQERKGTAHGSVLDKNLELQAMMEMVGKPMSGVYEPVEDPNEEQ